MSSLEYFLQQCIDILRKGIPPEPVFEAIAIAQSVHVKLPDKHSALTPMLFCSKKIPSIGLYYDLSGDDPEDESADFIVAYLPVDDPKNLRIQIIREGKLSTLLLPYPSTSSATEYILSVIASSKT